MKIGFIAEPYEESNASGMGYFVLEVMKNLPLSEKDELIVYSSRPVNPSLTRTAFKNVIVSKKFFGKFFYFLFLKKEVDVLLYVAPLLPFIVPRSIKAVVVCQEVGSQKTPVRGLKERAVAILRDRILTPLCFARASMIIAASHATKQDVQTFYKIPDSKIAVSYDGYQNFDAYSHTNPPFNPSFKPFFFFTGKVKPRKNVHGIVSGFIRFKKRIPSNTKLVIAGDHGGEYFKAMQKEIAENDLGKEVFFAGYISKEELYAYYTNALALVFPSFNEGFGMPPVEAMSLGLPVITSNTSCLPEVAGGGALLVNPNSSEDISVAMEKIWSDVELRSELIAKGLKRAKDFSWEKMGREYMQIIRSV